MAQDTNKIDRYGGEGFSFLSSGETRIEACRWLPQEQPIRSILLINHGMAEHIRRYGEFAAFLNRRGVAVYGADHRGHGRTAGSPEALGFFAPRDGWNSVVQDIRTLHERVRAEHPGLPVVMLGHSMGSFLTRRYLSLYGEELAGAVLSGTGYTPPLTAVAGRGIAVLETAFRGPRHPSVLLDKMSFGRFNKPFRREGGSGFEWLSRDEEQVAAYVADPLCGFLCRSAFFRDLLGGIGVINRFATFRGTPSKLPLLLVSGDRDPVGDRGRGVEKVFRLYRRAGAEDIRLELIEGARHECLNERDKEKTYSLIIDWMEKKVMPVQEAGRKGEAP